MKGTWTPMALYERFLKQLEARKFTRNVIFLMYRNYIHDLAFDGSRFGQAGIEPRLLASSIAVPRCCALGCDRSGEPPEWSGLLFWGRPL